MTDNVLQSFCERCGTRYTSSAPEPAPAPEAGKSRFGRFGRRGQDKAAAEPQPSAPATSPASDAFAGTFHFCMDCRQYVCTNCWNAEAGGCLTDRPPGRDARSTTGDAVKASPFAAGGYTPSWGSRASSGSSAASAASGDLDEWGRPRKPQAPKADEEEKKENVEFQPELDPWRGVVFSDDERRDEPAAEPASEPTLPLVGFQAKPNVETPPEAWPKADRKPEPGTTPATETPAWPEPDVAPKPVKPPPPPSVPAPVP
ncbi:MAG: hypothetical protein AB1Z67_03225, partial [Candidatus Limnocylindrales bacterium]